MQLLEYIICSTLGTKKWHNITSEKLEFSNPIIEQKHGIKTKARKKADQIKAQFLRLLRQDAYEGNQGQRTETLIYTQQIQRTCHWDRKQTER